MFPANLPRGIHSFFYTLLAFPRAWRFMLTHRLWRGLRSYGWVARMLVFVAVCIALYLVNETIDWIDTHQQYGLLDMAIASDGLLMTYLRDAYSSLSDGFLNWVSLVLLEVVIYHFMRQTLRIVLNRAEQLENNFKPFYQA